MKTLTKIHNANPIKPVEVAHVADAESGTHIDLRVKDSYPRTYKFSRMMTLWAYDVNKATKVAASLRKYYAVKAAVKSFYENNLGENGEYRITDRIAKGGERIEKIPLPAKLDKMSKDVYIELTNHMVLGQLNFFTDRETWVPASGVNVEMHLRSADPLKEDGATYRITEIHPLPVEESDQVDPRAMAEAGDPEIKEVSDFLTELAKVTA